jgi:thioredoxin reductase (NADPH)
MDEPILDCLIIGGGPAGLTAAIYLARFHLDILVVDGGRSRAAWIPCTRNVSGFTDGIAGTELLKRMREQACRYGAKIESEFITKLERDEESGLFTATWGSGCRQSRTVLLATGVSNRRPPMDEELHDGALARGLVRYCPICDGFEVTDKKVGVIGSDSHGVAEALFLRSYTADVTLVAPDKALRLKPEDHDKLKAAGIECVDGPAQAVAIPDGCIVVDTAEGHYTFDSIYPALGSDTHTQLAEQVGAALSEEQCIRVDSHMRTSVVGLYAAGDVVIGLDQISHAMGQGGVAATTMRNDLEKTRRLWRWARNSGSITTRPSSRSAIPALNGISDRLPPSSSISRRSPAP